MFFITDVLVFSCCDRQYNPNKLGKGRAHPPHMSQSKSVSEGNGHSNSNRNIGSSRRGTLHTGLLHGSLSLLSYVSQNNPRRVARPQ